MGTTSDGAACTDEGVRVGSGASGARFAGSRRLAISLLAAVFLLNCSTSPEPESIRIEGLVVTTSGQPVDGILVQVDASAIGGRSGPDGRFTLENLPAHELDLDVGARVPVSVGVGAFTSKATNQVIVRLDSEGEAANVDIVRNGCTSTVLLRSETATSPARSKITVEAEEGYEELGIRIERMRENADFQVFIQSDPAARGTLAPIGSIHTVGARNADNLDGVGELSFAAEADFVSTVMPFGTSVTALQGRRIEIRDETGAVQLVGTLPLTLVEGNSIVERDYLVRVGGPEDARGNVRVKSTPDCSRDNFWVQIKGLERRTTYHICIHCSGAAKTSSGGDAHVAGIPTYSLANATAGQGDEVVLAVTLDTAGETVIFAQAVLEYDSTALTFLDAELGGDAAGWFLTENPTLPFGTQTAGTNENVLVQLAHPMGNTFTGVVEIARLRFRTSATLTGSTCLAFDPCKSECAPPGQLHTFVNIESGTPLGGDDDLNLDGGCVTIQEFDCFEVTTSQGGEAHLFLKKKQCDILPCGVECVRDLQGAGIEVRDGTGSVVLSGSVPLID